MNALLWMDGLWKGQFFHWVLGNLPIAEGSKCVQRENWGGAFMGVEFHWPQLC
jgi:hypothetical protein